MRPLETFTQHQEAVRQLGYRMLGTLADAEDIVQETYLRWSRSGEDSIVAPRSWLLKTATRLALDRLKSARCQRETYVGPWLPEPWLVDENSPADRSELDETITMALLHVLDQLSPAERAAFLLHDVFSFSFEEIAEVLDRSSDACRKLASRARQNIRHDRPTFNLDPQRHQTLLAAFLRACQEGDLEGLKDLLSTDVALVTDGGAKVSASRKVLRTPDIVGRFFVGIFKKIAADPRAHIARPVTFNGLPGLLLEADGIPQTALCLGVDPEGRIRGIYAQRNPEKLPNFPTR
jgi:RNA polymerase sigma-70 factor (ECF subfamily)